jgi:hypothetical protein
MAVEARAQCGDCNNNNKVILINIVTDGNLTPTERLIKIILYLHNWCEKGKGGVRESRMGTKEKKISKAGRPCSWECYEKN